MAERRVTLLDLRLGLVELTEEQTAAIHRAAVPVLAQVAKRLIREQASAQVAAGKQD